MPLPNDGEVTCGACRRALNRSDTSCFACGSKKLDRSRLERDLTHFDEGLPLTHEGGGAIIGPPIGSLSIFYTSIFKSEAVAMASRGQFLNVEAAFDAHCLCPFHEYESKDGIARFILSTMDTFGCVSKTICKRRIVGGKWS